MSQKLEFKNVNPETKMMNNNSILDSHIEEINVPILRPTRYVPRREPPLLIYRNFNRFADWIMNLVPRRERGRVDRRIGRLRTEIGNIYARYRGIQLPHRTEAPLRGYLNTYRIDGQRGYDQTTFIQYARPRMMGLLRGMQRPIKMKLILTCKFQKGDDTTDFHSHANVQEVMQGDNIGDIINSMVEKILANIETFQGMGSGWQFESVVSLDINVDPFTPLEEPKPGLVDNVKDSVKNYILPPSTDTEGIEDKRESLAILASLGTSKDYFGVQMSLGDVKKLVSKDVEKYYYRYQSKLAKQVTGGLVENAIKLTSKMISSVIPIDDPDSLSNDLVQDEIVRRELVDAAGYLVLKGGRFVALASALFHVVSHVDFTVNEKILEQKPEHDVKESEHNAKSI